MANVYDNGALKLISTLEKRPNIIGGSVYMWTGKIFNIFNIVFLAFLAFVTKSTEPYFLNTSCSNNNNL